MAEAKPHPNAPKSLKAALFALLLGILFLPVLQEWTGILPQGKLAGVENPVDTVPLTKATWLEGQFQENFAIRHYRWMGLRPAMVRLHNQVDYSLFGETFRSIMVGKDGELFRRGSMNAMRGRNFMGQQQIDYHASHTATLKNLLESQGKRLLVVFTPSKLRLMPDQLPGYELPSPHPNNYDAFGEAFVREGLDFIDLTGHLQQKMSEQPHRVFPRTGTHWTDLGAYFGAELILREMQRRERALFRPMEITGYQVSDSMRDTDADAGDLLNLIVDLPPDTVAYPAIRFAPPDSQYVRPRVLVIGDSFWWKIYNQNIHKEVFAPGSQFRYYNYEVFSDQWEGARLVTDFDLRRTVEGVDWVILCFNEGNAHRYPFDFVDQVLSLFYR